MNGSKLLKDFRHRHNLSQYALSKELDVSAGLIASIETGLRQFSYRLNQKIYERYGENLLNPTESVHRPVNLAPVPFYSAKVAAGLGAELPTYPEKDILYFDKRLLNNVVGIKESNAVILQAEGDSMDSGMNKPNDIRNGDLLMVDVSQKDIINNKTYIIELNNTELVVKKVVKEWNGIIMLVSNNPLYPARPVTAENEAKIIGRVVWNVSKENV